MTTNYNDYQSTLDAMMVCAMPLIKTRRELVESVHAVAQSVFPILTKEQTWQVCDSLAQRFFGSNKEAVQ